MQNPITRPRCGSAAQVQVRLDMVRRDRWSWPSIAAGQANRADFARFMKTSEVSQLIQSVPLSNAAVSRILTAKYGILRAAFMLSIASLCIAGLQIVHGGA